MLKEMKVCRDFLLILLNHLVTEVEFLHWLMPVLARMTLLTLLRSDLAGLIRWHFVLFSKFSLKSVSEMKAGFLAMVSILSSTCRSQATVFNSWLVLPSSFLFPSL